MTRSNTMMKTLTRSAACATLLAGFTGCSAFQSSHIIAAKPAPSPYAVASADDEFYAQPFSLVAADSVGLATFGYEIAMWDDTPTQFVTVKSGVRDSEIKRKF